MNIIWNFRANAKPVPNTDGFWYLLNEGYLNPKDMLECSMQTDKLTEAIELVNSFENQLKERGLLMEY